jgi:hypothetical protein
MQNMATDVLLSGERDLDVGLYLESNDFRQVFVIVFTKEASNFFFVARPASRGESQTPPTRNEVETNPGGFFPLSGRGSSAARIRSRTLVGKSLQPEQLYEVFFAFSGATPEISDATFCASGCTTPRLFLCRPEEGVFCFNVTTKSVYEPVIQFASDPRRDSNTTHAIAQLSLDRSGLVYAMMHPREHAAPDVSEVANISNATNTTVAAKKGQVVTLVLPRAENQTLYIVAESEAMPDDTCALSYSGPKCVVCRETNWGLIFLFLGVVWFLVLVLVMVSRREKGENAFAQIATYFLQMAILFVGTFNQLLEVLNVFNLNISDIGALKGDSETCITPLTPYGNVATKLGAPFSMMFVLAFVICYSYIYHRCKSQQMYFPWTDYVRTASSVALFIYVPLTEAVFVYLNCIDVAGERVVAQQPAINCRDPKYGQWAIVVAVGLGASLLFPIVLFGCLVHKHRKLHPQSSKPYTETIMFKNRWGIFYERYKDETYYWTAWTLLRRTILVAIVTFIQDRGQRFSLASLVNLVALGLHIYWMPYLLDGENNMELISLVALLCITIVLGANDIPYSLGVNVTLILLIAVPTLLFAGFFVSDVVRKFQEEKLRAEEKQRRMEHEAKVQTILASNKENMERRRQHMELQKRVALKQRLTELRPKNVKSVFADKESARDELLPIEEQKNYYHRVMEHRRRSRRREEDRDKKLTISQRLNALWESIKGVFRAREERQQEGSGSSRDDDGERSGSGDGSGQGRSSGSPDAATTGGDVNGNGSGSGEERKEAADDASQAASAAATAEGSSVVDPSDVALPASSSLEVVAQVKGKKRRVRRARKPQAQEQENQRSRPPPVSESAEGLLNREEESPRRDDEAKGESDEKEGFDASKDGKRSHRM